MQVTRLFPDLSVSGLVVAACLFLVGCQAATTADTAAQSPAVLSAPVGQAQVTEQALQTAETITFADASEEAEALRQDVLAALKVASENPDPSQQEGIVRAAASVLQDLNRMWEAQGEGQLSEPAARLRQQVWVKNLFFGAFYNAHANGRLSEMPTFYQGQTPLLNAKAPQQQVDAIGHYANNLFIHAVKSTSGCVRDVADQQQEELTTVEELQQTNQQVRTCIAQTLQADARVQESLIADLVTAFSQRENDINFEGFVKQQPKKTVMEGVRQNRVAYLQAVFSRYQSMGVLTVADAE